MPYKRKYRRKPSKSIHKMVKKMIQKDKELKRVTGSLSTYSLSTTGYTNPITDIASGDGINNREGHEVRLKKFKARYSMIVGDATNEVRIVLYSKRNVGGADLAAGTSTFIDPDQYIVYIDKLCLVSASNANAQCTISKSWGVGGKKVVYDTTLSTTQTQGEVLLYFVSDSFAATHPTISGYHDLMFTE